MKNATANNPFTKNRAKGGSGGIGAAGSKGQFVGIYIPVALAQTLHLWCAYYQLSRSEMMRDMITHRATTEKKDKEIITALAERARITWDKGEKNFFKGLRNEATDGLRNKAGYIEELHKSLEAYNVTPGDIEKIINLFNEKTGGAPTEEAPREIPRPKVVRAPRQSEEKPVKREEVENVTTVVHERPRFRRTTSVSKG
jgi:hypothetical protein